MLKFKRKFRGIKLKIDLLEVGWWGGMDWIDLAQDRERWWDFVNEVLKFQGP